MKTPFHYVILRKDLRGGAAIAQAVHAAGESASLWSLSSFVNAAIAAGGAGRPISFGGELGTFVPAGATSTAVDAHAHLLPVDTRAAVLGATKEQITTLLAALLRENVPHKSIVETDGPLTGVVTAIGLVTGDKAALAKLLGELRPFSLGEKTEKTL